MAVYVLKFQEFSNADFSALMDDVTAFVAGKKVEEWHLAVTPIITAGTTTGRNYMIVVSYYE